MLPSLVDAVIVTFPSDLAITFALFLTNSMDATFSSLVIHSTSFTSAASFTVAVKILLPPKYNLLNLLSILILSANIISNFTVIVIVFVATLPSLSLTVYVTLYVPSLFVSTVSPVTSTLSVI